MFDDDGEVDYWMLDGLVTPDWDTNVDSFGQPNQLVNKIVEVLDDFYGKDKWINNPEAVFDIVAHSQGGMVARMAAYKNNSPLPDNPINHLNSIVTFGTPHHGTAFATDPNLLREGNEDNGDKKYPELARFRDLLLGNLTEELINIKKIYLPRELYLLMGGFKGTKIKNLSLTGSYLGPFDVEFKFVKWTPKWFKGGFLFPNPPIKFKFTIDPAKEMRENLKKFDEDAADLAWRADPRYDFTDRLFTKVDYPQNWSNGDKIKVTHLYSAGCDDFGATTFDLYRKMVNKKFLQFFPLAPHVTGPSFTKFVSSIFIKLQPALNDLRADVVLFDNEWSTDGDFVVEDWSQKGINEATGYDPRLLDRDFNVTKFSQFDNRITHIDLTETNPAYSYEAVQGYDVAKALGIKVRDIPDVRYLPVGTIAKSAFITSSTGDDDKIAVYFTNKSNMSLNGFSAEYYVTADSALLPELLVMNDGGISVSLDRCAGNLYRILFDAPDVILEPDEQFPDGDPLEFLLYYNTDVPWNYYDDYSFNYQEENGIFDDNIAIVVRTATGEIISGIAPDTSSIVDKTNSTCMFRDPDLAQFTLSQIYNSRPNQSLGI